VATSIENPTVKSPPAVPFPEMAAASEMPLAVQVIAGGIFETPVAGDERQLVGVFGQRRKSDRQNLAARGSYE